MSNQTFWSAHVQDGARERAVTMKTPCSRRKVTFFFTIPEALLSVAELSVSLAKSGKSSRSKVPKVKRAFIVICKKELQAFKEGQSGGSICSGKENERMKKRHSRCHMWEKQSGCLRMAARYKTAKSDDWGIQGNRDRCFFWTINVGEPVA